MYEQSDFESAHFDVTQFVDQLVEKSLSGAGGGIGNHAASDEFDSAKLYSVLSQTMSDLEELSEKMESEVRKQQSISRGEIEDQMHRVTDLEAQHERCSQAFVKLENDIMEIGKKLVSLGDQLESISQPHTRISEAKLLIANFNHFMTTSIPKDKFQSLAQEQGEEHSEASLEEYVELLTKMQFVLAELDESKFQSAAMNIKSAHANIENFLAEKFALAVQENDVSKMSKYAKLLSKFSCYSHKCVTVYIDRLLTSFSPKSESFFDDVLNQMQGIENEVQVIFEDSDHVFATFLNRLFMEVIRLHLDECLELTSTNKESITLAKGQLELLSSLEVKTNRFCDRVTKDSRVANKSSLMSLKTKLFACYLPSYISSERKVLAKFCEEVSSNFYSKLNHVKKSPQQLKTFGRKPFSESFEFQKFVYQDELIQIVKEVKACIERAEKLLHTAADKNEFGNSILDILFSKVIDENVVYALNLVTEGTPINPSELRDLKAAPFLTFFAIANRSFGVITEINDLYLNHIVYNPNLHRGLVANQAHCDELRQSKFEEVENLINTGIDRSLNFYSAWIKKIYNGQNLKEFQSLDDESIMHGPTDTCRQVCSFVQQVVFRVTTDLPHLGRQQQQEWTDEILLQFGLKFHSNLLSQIQKLQVSLYGGIQISMDLSEYKKVAESFNVPLLMKLFSSLQALCNLLITPDKHLKAVVNGPELEGFDPTYVHDFVKLRVDYRRNDLSSLFVASSAPS